jgi:hypothetical protein
MRKGNLKQALPVRQLPMPLKVADEVVVAKKFM